MLARELPRDPPPPAGLSLASFFCCAGGIDLGFRSAGVRTSFANDVDADAVAAFERNLGHAPLRRDIREVGLADYPAEPVDVVAGGFPCVTFSMAGRRAGVVDDLNGKLYLQLCRVIGEMRPRYFAAENVRGILSANGGAAVRLVLASFLRLGYRASWRLVNMAEHGVPQTRERVVFLGVRLDQWRGAFRWPERTRRLWGDADADPWLPVARTLRESIGDLPAPGERLLGMMHGDAAEKARRGPGVGGYHNSKARLAGEPSHSQTTQGGALLVEQRGGHEANAYGPRRLSVAMRRGHGGRRSPTVVSGGHVPGSDAPWVDSHEANEVPAYAFDQARVVARGGRRAPTATTPRQNQPFVEVLGRGGGLRRMTVRECARVQTFPDWFEFPASQAAGYRLVGNAVPPLYAKRLAEAILEYDARRVCG